MIQLKNIAIIPARGNSKRLPHKNIKQLAGIPLLVHSIKYAKKHHFIDKVYVSTENSEIKKIAGYFGATVIDRPEYLSGDLEPTVTAMKHVLETINETVENVILLQPTNPLRPEKLLHDAYHLYESNAEESLFTVSRNYHKLGQIKDNVFKPFNYTKGQRSQDLEPLFFENGLLYITKAELINREIIISDNAYPLEINHIYAQVDIDTQNDFNYANYILEHYPNE